MDQRNVPHTYANAPGRKARMVLPEGWTCPSTAAPAVCNRVACTIQTHWLLAPEKAGKVTLLHRPSAATNRAANGIAALSPVCQSQSTWNYEHARLRE